MKTVIKTKLKGTLLTLGLGVLSLAGTAQEHITLSLEHITTTRNTIEYDLVVINDGISSMWLDSETSSE